MIEDNSDRKIAVIFVTDVVGYSKAIENNEKQTLKNLKECRNILDNLILKHKGKIFNTAGDSVLAEFSSAVSAIECATLFQTKIRDRNSSAKDLEIMEFRIGIYIGDVVIDGKNLYGEGVNIAARLESFAQPNGLSISKSLFDLIEGKTQNKFRDLGIQKIKNNKIHVYDLISNELKKRKRTNNKQFYSLISVFIFLVLVCSTAILYLLNSNQKISDPFYTKKLLILPFEVRSADKSYEYLKQGTLEYLISNLSGVKLNNEQSIDILSTSLSNSISKKKLNDEEILKKYGANYILNGSIQISNNNLRINVKLNDVVNNKKVWSSTKNSKIENIFNIQDELTIDLLSFLGFGNQSSSRSGIMGKIKTPEEMKLLLEIIKTQRKFSAEAWIEMADLTSQFYAMNPDGIAQNVMKAWEYHWKVAWRVSKEIKKDLKKGLVYADTAIERSLNTKQNPQESYTVKAFLLMSSKKYDEALLFANKAKKVIVNNPEAWGGIGVVYFFCNDFKSSIEALELQSQLVMEQQLIFKDILAWAYIFENELNKAKTLLEEIILKKNHPNKLTMSQSYIMLSYIAHLEQNEQLSKTYFSKHLELEHQTTIAGFTKFKRFKEKTIAKDILQFLSKKGLN